MASLQTDAAMSMPPPFPPPDPLPLYRQLQREVRAAIDRCADGLGQQIVTCPSTPDDPETTLENILRAMLRTDPGGLIQRLLMVLGESARSGDAVAMFLADRMATFYAAQQLTAMYDLGLVSELQLGASHAA
jgi:hypothetical protein